MTDDPKPTQGDEDLSEYTVTIGGVEHSMMLTSQDAERYGEHAKSAKASKVSTKARQPDNKSG